MIRSCGGAACGAGCPGPGGRETERAGGPEPVDASRCGIRSCCRNPDVGSSLLNDRPPWRRCASPRRGAGVADARPQSAARARHARRRPGRARPRRVHRGLGGRCLRRCRRPLAASSDSLARRARRRVRLLVALIPYWVFVLYVYGLYRQPRQQHRLVDARRGGARADRSDDGLLGGLSCSSSLSRSTRRRRAGRLLGCRRGGRAGRSLGVSQRAVVRPALTERVLIVGAGEVGHLVAAKIVATASTAWRSSGSSTTASRGGTATGPPPPVLGSLADLAAVIARAQRRPGDRRLLAGAAPATFSTSCAPAPTTA